MDGDFSQLEFRVAGFLAQDQQVYRDVRDGVDVHAYTAEKIFGEVTKDTRNAAKADTFKPLYGGSLGSPKQMEYYKAFKLKYHGVTGWHEDLQDEAIDTGKVVLPSGREYLFPGTKRMPWGGVSGATAIKN